MLLRSGGGWALRLAGEAEARVDLDDHDPDRRAALAATDGFDRVLIAPSVPLGIEGLPAGEAEPLLAAYHEGVAALPAPFGAWAAVGLDAPDPAALAPLLDDGFAGACVSAGALGDRPATSAWARCSSCSSAVTRRCSSIPGPRPRRTTRRRGGRR